MDVWRVYFRKAGPERRHFDVETAGGGSEAIRKAHEAFRAERHGAMDGWWMTCWRPLVVWAGTDPPRLRRRVVLAWRHWRRNLAHA